MAAAAGIRALPDAATTAALAAAQLGVGVAPVGHPKAVRTLVDVTLARHPLLWAGAGTPHTVFPISYDELLRVTSGTPAEVA